MQVGADHGLRRPVLQVSDALEVDRKVATLQSAAEKRAQRRRSAPYKRSRTGSRSTSKSATGSSERPSKLCSVSVRSTPWAGKTVESELTARSELPREHYGEAAT